MSIKEMLEKRAAVYARLAELQKLNADTDHEWSDENEQNWLACNKDYDEWSERIKRAQRADALRAAQDAPADEREIVPETRPNTPQNRGGAPTQEQRELAVTAWFRAQSGGEISDAEAEAVRVCNVPLQSRDLELPLLNTRQVHQLQKRCYTRNGRVEFRDLVVGTPASGGYAVPTGFVANLEEALLAYGGVRQVATVIRTNTGEPLEWPTATDTGTTGEILTEAAAVAEADPTVGLVTLNAYKYGSKLVQVSAELVQDWMGGGMDISTFLSNALATRLGRITNTHFTTGTGSSQPNGVVTASGAHSGTVAGAGIAADDIFDLIHGLDPAYRVNASLMMHDTILATIRKLSTTDNQYLWQPGLAAGIPDTLLGYRLTINQDMTSATTSGQKSILFGDFSKYIIRDAGSIRFRRLVERYAENDLEGFVGFLRTDGELLDAGTDPVVHLIH